MLNINFSAEWVFTVLILVSGFLAYIGLFFNKNYPDQGYYSFYAFVIFSICYYLAVRRITPNV